MVLGKKWACIQGTTFYMFSIAKNQELDTCISVKYVAFYEGSCLDYDIFDVII
jgi:hypothetical protein